MLMPLLATSLLSVSRPAKRFYANVGFCETYQALWVATSDVDSRFAATQDRLR